jgi:hypothetical protein
MSKEFITLIMHNDRVWNSVKVDGVTKEMYGYSDHNDYIVNDYGFIMFRGLTPIMQEIHVCMLKCKNTQEIVSKAIDEMRAKGVKKFLAPIGDWNKSALKLSMACGFTEEGRIANAYTRNGTFHSMILMGSK